MKKIASFTIAFLLMMTSISFATGITPSSHKDALSFCSPVGIWVRLTITFHRPKYDCLRGFGLCFELDGGLNDGAGASSETGCPIKMKIENNQLILSVLESSLKVYENGSTLPYFKDKTFITIEDYTELPPGLTRNLGSSTPIIIKPGKYPVTFKDGIYTVVFQL